MKRVILLAVPAAALAGRNTFKGLGKDIEEGREAVRRAAGKR